MLAEIAVPDVLSYPLSKSASALIAEADRRIERFGRSRRPAIENFVVCDFALVDSALHWITEQSLACGEAFCEWGSGFGVVTMLASLHGMEAYGLEVEDVLVEQAEQLADDLHLEATFARGSFVPDGGEDLVHFRGEIEHVETDSPSGYHELGRDIGDFDLFFAFPWPGEHHYWEAIFDHYASDGSLLLTYQGIERLRLQRKVGDGPTDAH